MASQSSFPSPGGQARLIRGLGWRNHGFESYQESSDIGGTLRHQVNGCVCPQVTRGTCGEKWEPDLYLQATDKGILLPCQLCVGSQPLFLSSYLTTALLNVLMVANISSFSLVKCSSCFYTSALVFFGSKSHESSSLSSDSLIAVFSLGTQSSTHCEESLWYRMDRYAYIHPTRWLLSHLSFRQNSSVGQGWPHFLK